MDEYIQRYFEAITRCYEKIHKSIAKLRAAKPDAIIPGWIARPSGDIVSAS
ncbi:MAG: hypothetical protein M3O30_02545 [Planctomycetota bacterium]|nr:hypothetical protein [Planctomycetota bacterium]